MDGNRSDQLKDRFAGWETIGFEQQEFPAPGDTRKMFATLIARKPASRAAP